MSTKGCQNHKLRAQDIFRRRHDVITTSHCNYIGCDHGRHYCWGARLIRPLLPRLHTGGIKPTSRVVLYGTRTLLLRKWVATHWVIFCTILLAHDRDNWRMWWNTMQQSNTEQWWQHQLRMHPSHSDHIDSMHPYIIRFAINVTQYAQYHLISLCCTSMESHIKHRHRYCTSLHFRCYHCLGLINSFSLLVEPQICPVILTGRYDKLEKATKVHYNVITRIDRSKLCQEKESSPFIQVSR
jgi:hypothetical protein